MIEPGFADFPDKLTPVVCTAMLYDENGNAQRVIFQRGVAVATYRVNAVDGMGNAYLKAVTERVPCIKVRHG